VFAGTWGGGVHLTTDGGASWTQVNTGLLDLNVRSLCSSKGYLLAGIAQYGGGVWRRPLSEIITQVSDNRYQIPDQLELQQNYPNPFNPATVIPAQWPIATNVRLMVFDMLGREVATVADGRFPAGHHEFTFDGTGLSSGTYYYRLETAASVHTRSMQLIR
jgi:hypothetical protein